VQLDKGMMKFVRRMKEEPLIPLGMVLTVAALVGAARSMRKGDRARTNMMFRRRIYAQGFTVITMVAYATYYEKDRLKRKELENIEKKKEQAYKQERMIDELEAREADDKRARARNEKIRERRRLRDEAQRAKAQGSEAAGDEKDTDSNPSFSPTRAAAKGGDSNPEVVVAGDSGDKKQSSLLDQAAKLLGKGK
jgi:hypothetical protein